MIPRPETELIIDPIVKDFKNKSLFFLDIGVGSGCIISSILKELNIKLPNAPEPVGAYVAFKKIGKLIYISGQLPIDSNGKMIKGKIGEDLSLEDGQKASKLCVINIIAQARKAMNGDLDKIKNCVKITGFVNSSNSFVDQPKVINPASAK